MTGRNSIEKLTKGWSAEKLAQVERRKVALRKKMALREIREALALSQQDVAKRLAIRQPAVAKLERRGDMHVGKLRCLVEAMGGRLRMVAEFPDGDVTIMNFESPARGLAASRKSK